MAEDVSAYVCCSGEDGYRSAHFLSSLGFAVCHLAGSPAGGLVLALVTLA